MVDSESVVEYDCVKNKNNKPDGFSYSSELDCNSLYSLPTSSDHEGKPSCTLHFLVWRI